MLTKVLNAKSFNAKTKHWHINCWHKFCKMAYHYFTINITKPHSHALWIILPYA